jgi:phosphatidylethanolamine/phosphatidyl-N-methylethanolamine N-methyltransferase
MPPAPRNLADYRVFFREFLRDFHATGAIWPSSRWLANALARYIADGAGRKRILEVGPGTGAVTRQIIAALGPRDGLDLVELNETFVQLLERRFASDPHFRRVANRTQLIHKSVEELPAEATYDRIISGLPFNNFPAATVARILENFSRLLTPTGTLSFFEYVAVRPTRSLVSGRAERERLRDVGRTLRGLLGTHEFHRELVWSNFPPAWVHHVRFDGNGQARQPSNGRLARRRA